MYKYLKQTGTWLAPPGLSQKFHKLSVVSHLLLLIIHHLQTNMMGDKCPTADFDPNPVPPPHAYGSGYGFGWSAESLTNIGLLIINYNTLIHNY